MYKTILYSNYELTDKRGIEGLTLFKVKMHTLKVTFKIRLLSREIFSKKKTNIAATQVNPSFYLK